MDPPARHAISGHLSKSKKPHSRQDVTLLGRRMANPPPRFLQASKLQDLTPYHVPEVEGQLTRAEQYPSYAPAPVHTIALSIGIPRASSHLYRASPALCPQLEAKYPHLDRIAPPSSPSLREPNPLARSLVNRMPPCPGYVPNLQAPAPPQVYSCWCQAPDPVSRYPSTPFHPVPRRPIHLPEVRSPFQSPRSQPSQAHYKQASEPLDTSFDHTDFSLDLGETFREDNRFLNARTTRVTPCTAADILASISSSSSASTNSSDQFVDPGDGPSTISISIVTPPRIVELRTYIALMGERFGCCITYDLVKKLIDPELLAKPLLSFDDRQSETYKRRVRSWAATATGTTIFEKLLVAFEPGTYINNERYTIPYFWFVLLVRELLIDNCYAKGLGTLIRLGACCVDPCNRTFRFFSLETTIRQLLGEMNSKPRFYTRDTTTQQRVVGRCHGDHLHITMSNQSFSNLYLPIPAPRFDKIQYQNELRAWFVRLVNRVDSCSGFTAFVLMTFMDLEHE